MPNRRNQAKKNGSKGHPNQMSVRRGVEISISGITNTIGHFKDAIRRQVNPNAVYRIVETYDAGSVIGAVTVSSGALKFQLDQLNNLSSYTSLFDCYRIEFAEVEFIPINPSGFNPDLDTGLILNTVLDYDDAAALSTESNALQYSSCLESTSMQRVVRTLVPRAAMSVYNGAFSSFARVPVGTWIDIASANVQYYGVKYVLSALPVAEAVFRIRVKLTVSFKNTR
jgi:hypothetical protein